MPTAVQVSETSRVLSKFAKHMESLNTKVKYSVYAANNCDSSSWKFWPKKTERKSNGTNEIRECESMSEWVNSTHSAANLTEVFKFSHRVFTSVSLYDDQFDIS